MARKMSANPRGRDKEEVRLENPVPQVLASYGVKVVGGRYVPFCHASKKLDGKVSRDSCFCFVCGKNFDCFGVVGHFEGLSNLNDQVSFLGGEELPDDDPKRKALKEKAKKIKEAKATEEAAREAFVKEVVEKTNQIHVLRSVLRRNKPVQGEWPSKEWAEAYNKLQELDFQVACLLGDEVTGGNISQLPEAIF